MIAVLVGALSFNAAPRLPSARRASPVMIQLPFIGEQGPDVKALSKIQDIKIGAGEEAAKGTAIKFDFKSRVVDGDELDSAQGVAFELGKVDLIPGWLEGLSGMKPGGVRTVALQEDLWKTAQPSAIKNVPKGQGAVIEFEFTMQEVQKKSVMDMIGIAPTTQNLAIGAAILLIGLFEGVQALSGAGADGDSMMGM